METEKTDMLFPDTNSGKYILVSADMGYGHNRAIFPLQKLAAEGRIININDSPDSTLKEKRLWRDSLRSYEFMSRAGRIPVIGGIATRMLNKLLMIPDFYPRKNLSGSTFPVRYLRDRINKGLCSGFIDYSRRAGQPVISSFYVPAVAADLNGLAPVYCIICDTDLNRIWVSENPEASGIIYFAPGTTAVQRLLSYGVPEKNIILSGFPLPAELLGGKDLSVLKSNLIRRLDHLDPSGIFRQRYSHSMKAYLGTDKPEFQGSNAVTITYAVGGAGAQKEIGMKIARSLAGEIGKGTIILNLVAGTRPELRKYFLSVKDETAGRNDGINIIWGEDFESYYHSFNNCLQTTDILWTKPSELSFYCALGLPVIISDAIGPQEKCNRKWLYEIGAGIKQMYPDYTVQWLNDLLNKGRLAEAAWNGYLKGRKLGTFNIAEYLNSGQFLPES